MRSPQPLRKTLFALTQNQVFDKTCQMDSGSKIHGPYNSTALFRLANRPTQPNQRSERVFGR